MADDYQELDVFGRPVSQNAGVPYAALDNNPGDEASLLQAYLDSLKHSTALPGYVNEYRPGWAAQDEANRNPIVLFPSVRQGIENLRAVANEGMDTGENIWTKIAGPKRGETVNTLGGVVKVKPDSFGERFHFWPEKMARSGISLAGDVMSGQVPTGVGLRPGDFSDDPRAPQPLGQLIERTQDMAGLAAGGSLVAGVKPELPSTLSNALGKGYKAVRQAVAMMSDDEIGTAINSLTNASQRDTNVQPGAVVQRAARNIGREDNMPQILAKQRASEGYEAAIRDPETKKLYTGMWHDEVIDKMARDKGVPRDELPVDKYVKGYVDYNGRFLSEAQLEKRSASRTATFRADDETGAAVSALEQSGKAPEMRVAQANLPALRPDAELPSTINKSVLTKPTDRRSFLRGMRDMGAAMSNANRIVGMAEKLGQTPIPKNPKVPLKEIWKTGDLWAEREKLADQIESLPVHEAIPEPLYNRMEELNAALDEGGSFSQYDHNQLPGGTNYREHLMQMPEPQAPKTLQNAYLAAKEEHHRLGNLANWNGYDLPTARAGKKVEDIERTIEDWRSKQNYRPHYGSWDEPDVIGHTTMNDRTLPNGDKALHVEDIGSELHAEGAKHGYGNNDGSVPDLPFKKTWADLATNRMLVEAADKGYDAISWTPHDLQGIEHGKNNKELHNRVEKIAKQYGGKIEKQKIGEPIAEMVPTTKNPLTGGDSFGVREKHFGSKEEGFVRGFDTEAKAKAHLKEVNDKASGHYVYSMHLTPEMKRVFSHEDFSMFPKEPKPEPLARKVLERGRSGRPTRTEPFSDRGDQRILEEGARRVEQSRKPPEAPMFYSGVERAVTNAKMTKGTPEQWLGYIRNQPGVKGEEMSVLALEDWAKNTKGQVTKEQFLEHVRKNKVELQDVVKHGPEVDETHIQDRAQEIMDAEHPDLSSEHAEYFDHFADATNRAEDELKGGSVKYSDYQLPGGTNYREHLTTLPDNTTSFGVFKNGEQVSKDFRTAAEARTWGIENGQGGSVRETTKKDNYRSSHWDEPNVLVHRRMNDRDLPSIGKSLHLEEVQSDLHQEGRKKGYKEDVPDKKIHAARDRSTEAKTKLFEAIEDLNKRDRLMMDDGEKHHALNDLIDNKTDSDSWHHIQNNSPAFKSPEFQGLLKEAQAAQAEHHGLLDKRRGVPDAPFKTTWPDLAIKKTLREAVDNGYDAVSWTPGEAQAERYSLSKDVNKLHYDKLPNGSYVLVGEGKNGQDIKVNRGLPVKEKDLASHIGDEIAEKIVAGHGDGTLENTDLKMGGEGMKKFYNKMLVDKFNALVKKYGGKVERHKLEDTPQDKRVKEINKRMDAINEDLRANRGKNVDVVAYKKERNELLNERFALEETAGRTLGKDLGADFVHVLKITPQMRKAFKEEGFPLFSAGVPVPVDHDPFKDEDKKRKLVPVDHDPFVVKPVPKLGRMLNETPVAPLARRGVANGFRPVMPGVVQ